MNSLAEKKIRKAMKSLQKALTSIEKDEKRIAIGDLHYVKENADEAIYILLAELEEKGC